MIQPARVLHYYHIVFDHITLHKIISCKVESRTIQLRLPRLGVAKYRSAMEHELTSSEMT